jgi:hypothetical protein
MEEERGGENARERGRDRGRERDRERGGQKKWSGSVDALHLRLIDCCNTQL